MQSIPGVDIELFIVMWKHCASWITSKQRALYLTNIMVGHSSMAVIWSDLDPHRSYKNSSVCRRKQCHGWFFITYTVSIIADIYSWRSRFHLMSCLPLHYRYDCCHLNSLTMIQTCSGHRNELAYRSASPPTQNL